MHRITTARETLDYNPISSSKPSNTEPVLPLFSISPNQLRRIISSLFLNGLTPFFRRRAPYTSYFTHQSTPSLFPFDLDGFGGPKVARNPTLHTYFFALISFFPSVLLLFSLFSHITHMYIYIPYTDTHQWSRERETHNHSSHTHTRTTHGIMDRGRLPWERDTKRKVGEGLREWSVIDIYIYTPTRIYLYIHTLHTYTYIYI